MTERDPWFPAPGSHAAEAAGCTCPVIDNGRGRGYLGGMQDPATGETMYVITVGCPLHSEAANSHLASRP